MDAMVDIPQDTLVAAVDRLENSFASRFANWDQLNLPSAAHYFQQSYVEAIRTLRRISEEQWKENSDPVLKLHLELLFKRTVALLPLSIEYAKEARNNLRPVHKALLSNVQELGERHDVTGTNGLAIHIIRMYKQLDDIWPPAREAWVDSGLDLKPDAEFDNIYEDFCLLYREQRHSQGDHERYARQSSRLLVKALEALHLPESQLDLDDSFFKNETRPTYVSFPCNSKEFLYGIGKRPGILSVKARLGGPLTADQQSSLESAAKMSNQKSLPKHPRNPGVGKDYKMDQSNAIADFQDALHDSEALNPGHRHIARPGAELITPTWGIRKEILIPYRQELEAIAERIYKEFKMPVDQAQLPKSPDQRVNWIQPIAEEIKNTRASINHHMKYDNTSNKAKSLRLAAYKLKLLRAVFMIGLFSGIPRALPPNVQNALGARLDDWILHEQAWVAGDRHIMAHGEMDKKVLDELQQDIAGREANIARWTEMKDQMTGDSVTSQRVDGSHDSGIDVVSPPEVPEDTDPVLDDDTIRSATILLKSVLRPTIPDAGDYVLDVREERRRRRWYEKVALARLTGDSAPQWTCKRVVDPFTAGGPPQWEHLPRQGYWECLQFMWIMTHWRFYQLRELEL
ncbi:hypothetical protein NPX13_g6109 [Xylaria arbuscula]|uniref:Uncharacterized protein n=1 Tax=Xylaria arbuscula TaxID=114810 RepID=A0A9W8ND49_9PEZI|nr:hypothetical protein NPX13_g6109 [Xylaria arbuscula]